MAMMTTKKGGLETSKGGDDDKKGVDNNKKGGNGDTCMAGEEENEMRCVKTNF